MSIELKWKIEGEEQLARRLTGLGNRVRDFKSEFKKSSNFLKDFFGGEVFDSEGRAIGEKWVGGPSYHRLQRSGKMRRGFKAKAKRLEAKVWNAVDYFKYHQSKEPRYRIPRRVMMKLTEQLKTKIVHIFHEGVWKKVNKIR